MARQPQGRFLGVPYNWDRPGFADLRESIWDPHDNRIFTPKTYGWGYNINLAALAKCLARR